MGLNSGYVFVDIAQDMPVAFPFLDFYQLTPVNFS
jgi:hypothetical protein